MPLIIGLIIIIAIFTFISEFLGEALYSFWPAVPYIFGIVFILAGLYFFRLSKIAQNGIIFNLKNDLNNFGDLFEEKKSNAHRVYPMTQQNIPDFEKPIINLDELKVSEAVNQIKHNLNKGSSPFIIFKWLDNKSMELDNKRLKLLLEQIQEAQGINKEIINLKADLIINQQILDYMLDNKFELVKKEFEFKITEYESGINRMKAEDERLKIENAVLRARQIQEEAKADFIKNTLANVDLKNLSQALQSLITQVILSPDMGGYTPAEMLDELNKLVLQEKKYQIALTKAEAQKAKQQAELERLGVEREYKQEGKEPPGF